MNYGDVLFGIWVGFMLTVAWYEFDWRTQFQFNDAETGDLID